MANQETTSKLILQGDASGLIATMEKAEAQVKRFTGMVDTASSVIGKFTGVMGIITGVLAGGAMFKAAADETLKWTGEAMKLSKQLGITTEQASILNLAAGDVYLSMDTLTRAADALTKNSIKNKDAFEHYGIALKDSNGRQRDTLSIMQDVNEEILRHAEGREREVAGMQLYGKAWTEVRGIVKLNAEVMAEAQRKAEDLHLIVGPEGVARQKAYKASMNDVGDIMMSLKIQVGNHLLPILTNLGVWFNDVGPIALFLFEGALKGIMTFVHSVTLGFGILWETWKAFWGQFSVTSVALVQVITQIISGDFSGAWQTAKQGMADFGKFGDQWMDNIIKKSTATNEQLQRLWGLKQPKARPEQHQPEPSGGADPYEKDSGDKTSKLLSLEDARLKALLQGYKNQEQAIKARNAILIAEDEFFLKTGLESQTDFNAKKYELERQGLINTMSLIDQEKSAIEDAKVKKLAIATDATERAKIVEQAKEEAAAKVAEKEKLNSDLYLLDLKYFTDVRVTTDQQEQNLANARAEWAQKRRNSQEQDLLMSSQFQVMVDESNGNQFTRQLVEMEQEKKAWEESWAMQSDSFEEYERRKTLIEQLYANKRKNIERDEFSYKMGLTAQGFGNMASIADSFYQLSGKKSKEALKAYQVLKSGETIITTADTAMKAYNSLAPIPFVGPALGVAAAAAAIMAGATQLQNIWSVGADGSGGSLSVSGGSAAASGSAVTQPVSESSTPPQQVQVVLQVGNLHGDRGMLDRWMEDTFAPAFKGALGRSVDLGVAYSKA